MKFKIFDPLKARSQKHRKLCPFTESVRLVNFTLHGIMRIKDGVHQNFIFSGIKSWAN